MRFSLWDLLFECRDMIRLFGAMMASMGFSHYAARGGRWEFYMSVIFTFIAVARNMKAVYYFPVIFISCMAYFLLGARLFARYASWLGYAACLFLGYLRLKQWP